MKKLESLNNSQFEKFQAEKLNNLALCVGGTQYDTCNSKGSDCWDPTTCGGYTVGNYNNVDYWACK